MNFFLLCCFCSGIVEDTSGHTDFTIAEGDQTRIAGGAPFMVGSKLELAIGRDTAVTEETWTHLVQCMHLVRPVKCAGGLSKSENLA